MKGKFDTLIDQDTPVLIDFYADWCGPCQAMTPVFKEVAAKYDGKVKIIKIDDYSGILYYLAIEC